MALPPKTKAAAIRLTPDQYQLIEQRAERCKVSVSVWMRSILMQAASRSSRDESGAHDGYLRIREPNGDLS
jgi:uncharacterized protein (DUF1778 family)